QIKSSALPNNDAVIHIKKSNIDFGTTPQSEENLPNPAELLLGSFSACVLKNVERFSTMMKFSYTKATLEVKGKRIDNPPRIESISYLLIVNSNDPKLNVNLLKKNIEKFGTIYNTLKMTCTISGNIEVSAEV